MKIVEKTIIEVIERTGMACATINTYTTGSFTIKSKRKPGTSIE